MSFHYPIGGGGGGVTDLNGLTGAVTLSAGNNVTLNESGNDIEITANFTQDGKYMISGGITWSGTGLTYDVSFLNYFFNGNKTANPTQVTLAASDPTNNRFDAIVVDEAGTVTTITGTPSANPEVPAIPEDQLQVTIILVAAGSTTPTITSEEIYMDDPTTNWTFSTYTTGTPTGSINFAGTSSPKQGTECIEASTDARLGARFVRGTSFDAFQYTMLQVWVRFTGTAVASNKSLNVRFENSAGTLVANTVNLFNYGLQRGVLNTWQLVVVPITAFGALPATVKGLKVIMAGGTVGVVRQWDIDYMILTNGSVPYANVPTIAFYKDNVGIASQSGLNIIQGLGGTTITGVNNPTLQTVDYTFNAFGGDTLSFRDPTTKVSFIATNIELVEPSIESTVGLFTGIYQDSLIGAGSFVESNASPETHFAFNIASIREDGLPNGMIGGGVLDSGTSIGVIAAGLYEDTYHTPYFEMTAQVVGGGGYRTLIKGDETGLRLRTDDNFLLDSSQGYIRLRTNSIATDYWDLPTVAGAEGEVLTAHGDGVAATWEAAGGGSSNPNGSIQVSDGAGGFDSSANFLYVPATNLPTWNLADGIYIQSGSDYRFGRFDSTTSKNYFAMNNTGQMQYITTKVPTPVVTFTGTGANNYSSTGLDNYDLTTPTTYTVTIDTVPYESPAYFVTAGLNDITFTGTNTSGKSLVFSITISTTGATDQFDWVDSENNSGTNVNCDTSPILLSNGISIQFASITGHTVNDNWIKGYDIGAITFTTTPVSGSFAFNEGVTQISTGATGVLKYNSGSGLTTLTNIVGNFDLGDTIEGDDTGAILTLDNLSLGYGATGSMGDTFEWTDGTDTVASKPIFTGYGIGMSHNIVANFSGSTNHAIGDEWSFTVTPVNLMPIQWLPNSNILALGDYSGFANSTFSIIDDSNRSIENRIENTFSVTNGTGHKFLNIQPTAGLYGIGALEDGNGNKLSIDDSTNEITLATTHTQQSPIAFTGSGLDDLTLIGKFSGTAPITYTVTIDGVNVDIISIESSTISGGTFAVGNTITNGLGGTATVTSVVEVDDSGTLFTYLGINISAGTFGSSETIDNGTGVTGTGSYEPGDTFGFTDGTITYSNAPVLNSGLLSNGIKAKFANPTGHTLSDSWTWTYSTANQNVLDFSNNDYKFQSTFGTDTFGYQIGDNLLGYGLKGSVNTWVNGSDLSLSGTYFEGTTLTTGTVIQIGSASAASLLEIDKSYASISDGTDSGNYNLRVNQLGLSNTIGGIDYGIEQSAGVVTIGNTNGGNNTRITIDDQNYLFGYSSGIIRGNALHNNSNVAQGDATQQDVRSGTYTPTLTNVTNITTSTAYKFQWMRVGNVVTVSGRVNIQNTATGASELGISLPIASDIGATTDCVGSAPGSTAGILDDVGWVIGDATNNRAAMQSTAIGTGAHDHWVSFTYEVK